MVGAERNLVMDKAETRSMGEATFEGIAREAKLAEQEILRQSLEEKDKLLSERWDQFLRTKAELENYRRRAENEKAQALAWGQARILAQMIPVLEQLKKGCEQLEALGLADPKLKDGFKLVVKNLEKILDSEGVKKIEAPEGKPYDPHYHEVIRVEERGDSEGLIIGVVQEGFTLGERVLIPSKVIVSKKKTGGLQ